MADLNNVSTTIVGNQNISYNGSVFTTEISIGSDMTDFFELVLAALGYDITYDDFRKMKKHERNKLIRDIKLKTII